MHSRRFLLIGTATITAVTLAIGVLFPVLGQAAPTDNYGFIRFIHTAIDVGALDIYAGDSQTPLITNLHYGDYTGFITLPTTVQGYFARPAGSGPDGPVLAKLNRRVKANQSEIISAAGLDSRLAFVLEPLVIVRNATKGKARVRIFNTVWGGPYLTVTDTDNTVYGQDLQYLTPSGDTDINPGVYTLEIHSGATKPLSIESNVNLDADTVYTLMILGGMDNDPPVHLEILSATQETTRVRIVNQSTNAADVYLQGSATPLIQGLQPNASTNYVGLPSGSATFILRAAGSPPNSQELAFVPAQLRPSRDVTITLNGGGIASQMGITDDHLTSSTTPTASLLPSTPDAGAPAAATSSATMATTLQATAAAE